MNQTRTSPYRTGLQVSAECIARMDDNKLNLLMMELLKAQAYRCGSPVSKIIVNTKDTAADKGCDGRSGKPEKSDEWLGSDDTCWQFKSGKEGEPAKLKKEGIKETPNETLSRGGRFVVVASGSTSGNNGEQARLKELIDNAKAANLPTDKIEVIGSERLTTWCNQHPAIAGRLAGYPDGVCTLDKWSQSDEHKALWQGSPMLESEINTQRSNLDFATGKIFHLHIQGPPGVGKTRFALELCREAPWSRAVIYVRQARDVRLSELIDTASNDDHIQLTVVADEVQYEDLRPLCDSVNRSKGRVRLITIGHSSSPDSRRIPALSINPLPPEIMGKVIKGYYSSMPPEHVDFIVRFADGYMRLALLAANAIMQSPTTMNVSRLVNSNDISMFLNSIMGGDQSNRVHLYVVAVLTHVGWTEDKEQEGKAVAQHFKFDWNTVRATVESFHRRFSIAPRSGRYRYISPTPLGIYLALEASTTYPELLKTLPSILPSEAQDAYYERLQSMASNSQVQEYTREELAFFFRINDFIDARSVRRWSALSSAHPEIASSNILRALSATRIEDRMRIKDEARREIVWTLVRLAWKSSSFDDAVKALAFLAEAENETWANNASAEFLARFQIFLGGTSVPYLKRLSVLDDLLEEKRLSLTSFAVEALAKIGTSTFFRLSSSPASNDLPEKEWQPLTEIEHFQCLEAAIIKLSTIVESKIPNIEPDLVSAAGQLSMMLRQPALKKLVADFFDKIHKFYPMTREPLRRIIADIINREKNYWKKLSAEEIQELDRLHARFEDSSLGSRLQQHIGLRLMNRQEQPQFLPLAQELLSTPSLLEEHWPWLTSGQASNALRFGEVFASLDSKGKFAESLPLIPSAGVDLRFLCGYVSALRQTLGNDWYDSWVRSQFNREPKPISLLIEVGWRCGVTEYVANMLTTLVVNEQIAQEIVGQLAFGSWTENLAVDVLERVLQALKDKGHRNIAIGILERRMKDKPLELEQWKSLALQFVRDADLIQRSDTMESYYWEQVSNLIVGDYPREIADAIFCKQTDREPAFYFSEYSGVEEVLLKCVKQDPSGVWQVMRGYLSSPSNYKLRCPQGILDGMPQDEVLTWFAENPEDRARLVATLTSKNMSTDETLASRLIGIHGDNERVADAFYCEYISGIWSGKSSTHSNKLAETLEEVAKRTALPILRRWAEKSALAIRENAKREQKREEEEDLRWR
jgi:DNA polymerase III delta prime subunit